MFENIIDLFKMEKRPYVSTILWFFGGVIEIICLVSYYSPFCIGCDFIDAISITEDISKINLIHSVAFISVVVCAITWCIRYLPLVAARWLSEEDIRKIYIFVYTFYDVVDLFSSIIAILFMFFIFILQYQTKPIMCMCYDWIVYLYIAIRFISFSAYRFCAKNSEIVNNTFKKYSKISDS